MVSPSIASATRPARVTWRSIVRLTAMVLALLFLIVPHLCYRAVGRPSPMVMAFLNAVGWIADQNHTIYVQREAKREIHNQANDLRNALARGRPVTLFPEGTTGPGDGLLPFRASLFQAVIPTPPNLQIQPVFMDYGAESNDIAWLDPESGLDNFKRLLARAKPIHLTIHYLDPLPASVTHDRKAISEAARAAIAQEMAATARPSAHAMHRL